MARRIGRKLFAGVVSAFSAAFVLTSVPLSSVYAKDEAITIPVQVSYVGEDGQTPVNAPPDSYVELKLSQDGYDAYDIYEDYVDNIYFEGADGIDSFADLPKYDEQGGVIDYDISVENYYPGTGFTFVSADFNDPSDVTRGFTYVAKQGPVLSIPVEVKYVGGDGVTPVSPPEDGYVEFAISHNGTYVTDMSGREVESICFDGTSGSSAFVDLPGIDEYGEAYIYNVWVEQYGVGEGFTFVSADLNDPDDVTKGITFIAKKTETIDIPVKARWLSADGKKNADGPDYDAYVNVDLYSEGELLESVRLYNDENWEGTFYGRPKYHDDGKPVDYSVEIDDIYTPGFLDGALTRNDDSDLSKGFTYTAKQNGFITIPVTMSWVSADGSTSVQEPEEYSAYFNITRKDGYDIYDKYGNRVEYVEISNYSDVAGFYDLPQYDNDGTPIEYEVTYNGNFWGKGFVGGVFTQNDSTDVTKGFTFTATQQEVISIPVDSKWLNETGRIKATAPDSGYCNISIGTSEGDSVYDIDGNYVYDIRLSPTTSWSGSFDNLPTLDYEGNPIQYVLTVDDHWTPGFLDGALTQNDETDITKGFTYTSKKNTAISIPVTANWLSEDKKTPAEGPENGYVRFSITRNGSGVYDLDGDYVKDITLSAPEWSSSFVYLPKYNDDGTPIDYTIEESYRNTPGFMDGTLSQNDETDLTKGFTYTAVLNEVIDIPVEVKWTASNGTTEVDAPADGYVGFSLTDEKGKAVRDKNGYNVQNIYLQSGECKALFEGLYRYNADGSEIKYKVVPTYFKGEGFNEGTLTRINDKDIAEGYIYKSVREGIDPTGITLDKKLLVLGKGEVGALTPAVKPENATDKTVTWSSSDPNIVTVDADGKITAVNHGSAKITAATFNGKTATCEVRVNFIDVTNPKDWYYKAVYWAVDKGIVTGSNGYFHHAKDCTREQAITMLWRLAGKPNPKSMISNFSDVKNPKSYSYKAILWGNEQGLILGKNGKFNPGGTCTREQIVTMIWRMAGKPEPKSATSNFSDVTNKKSYSYKAVLWANEQGIAKGSNGKFLPTAKCKRRDIVTFIYRYANLK